MSTVISIYVNLLQNGQTLLKISHRISYSIIVRYHQCIIWEAKSNVSIALLSFEENQKIYSRLNKFSYLKLRTMTWLCSKTDLQMLYLNYLRINVCLFYCERRSPPFWSTPHLDCPQLDYLHFDRSNLDWEEATIRDKQFELSLQDIETNKYITARKKPLVHMETSLQKFNNLKLRTMTWPIKLISKCHI